MLQLQQRPLRGDSVGCVLQGSARQCLARERTYRAAVSFPWLPPALQAVGGRQPRSFPRLTQPRQGRAADVLSSDSAGPPLGVGAVSLGYFGSVTPCFRSLVALHGSRTPTQDLTKLATCWDHEEGCSQSMPPMQLPASKACAHPLERCTQEIAPGATVQSLVTHQQQRTLSQHEQTRHTSHTAQHVSRHLPGLKLGKRSWQGARKAACAQAARMAVTYRMLLDLCPLLAVPGWGLLVAEARDTDDASALSPALLSGCSGLSPYTAQASSHVGLLRTFQPLSPKYCKAAQYKGSSRCQRQQWCHQREPPENAPAGIAAAPLSRRSRRSLCVFDRT